MLRVDSAKNPAEINIQAKTLYPAAFQEIHTHPSGKNSKKILAFSLKP